MYYIICADAPIIAYISVIVNTRLEIFAEFLVRIAAKSASCLTFIRQLVKKRICYSPALLSRTISSPLSTSRLSSPSEAPF